MNRTLMGVSEAGVIAVAPLCTPPVQAHADNPCVSITDPGAHQACIDKFQRDNPMRRHKLGDGEGQAPLTDRWAKFVGNFWLRKSAPPMEGGLCGKD